MAISSFTFRIDVLLIRSFAMSHVVLHINRWKGVDGVGGTCVRRRITDDLSCGSSWRKCVTLVVEIRACNLSFVCFLLVFLLPRQGIPNNLLLKD